MAIESDVIVIGGGLAGRFAAIAAADAGAETRLVTANQSTLRQASGLIDVLGYPPTSAAGSADAGPEAAAATGGQERADDTSAPDDPRPEDIPGDGGPIVDPFAVLPDLPEGHPYERVGATAVRDGLATFDDVVEGYAGAHTDANALVPTHGGVPKPTARYPESAAAGLASDDRDAVLVGFETLTDFDAPVAASNLAAAGVPFDVAGITVRFPGELRADAKATRYAELLEDDEVPRSKGSDGAADAGGSTTDASQGRSCRAAIVERIGRAVADLDFDPERVGFPAVLGEEESAAVRADFADRLGVPVFEVPAGPPSLPGIRLEGQLRDALRDRGVRVADGRPVVDFAAADGRVEHLIVESAGGSTVPMAAERYVLATGGLVGRGIDSDRDGVREPIFDCHVPHPADRYEWFADDAFGDHPFAYFGVDVDRELRPLDADGSVAHENLHAAGAVLGGYDFAAENSGAGVSIATGYAAGNAAAEGS
ncbi:glycerol-3-phosphate dehydrogenase subunit GlpB [Salinarchaeum chitinilyticum]